MDRSNECLTAFKNESSKAANRLLYLLVEQVKKVRMEIHPDQRLSLGTMLSKYTISIRTIIPWDNDNLEAGLLHLSSRNGWLDITEKLIEQYHLDLMKEDKKGNTSFHYAAAKNQLEVMKYLITRGQLIGESHSIRNKYGATPTHIAAANRSLDVMEYLIKHHHWNTKDTDYKGWTVLHYGFIYINVVDYLITECNCDPIVTDKDGKTVLHYAVEHNCLTVVKYLVLTGKCDPILAANKYGNTVLLFAATNGTLDTVKYLIHNHKCDPKVTDKNGKTVFHYAVEHINILKYLTSECNCDPMVTDKNGKTVLHYAAGEHIKILKYLTSECNFDPMITDKNGKTVLHYAVEDINNVKYLISECNCDPMATDKDGKTVLHYAVQRSGLDVIEYLLLTGKCDPVAEDNMGRTPLQLTQGFYRQMVLLLFMKFGQVTTSHPVDSYVNVLLLGNSGAGKSTLSQVIIDTATGSITFGFSRNVKGVESCTAGIIPYKLQHKTLGNIILHDFAGHSEYYSSHSAVIENLLQGSGGVFLIVVNILENGAVKQLHQWLTVVRNEAQKAVDQKCHVIVVVSHVDQISTIFHNNQRTKQIQRREEIQEIIGMERSVFLDCRKLGGDGVDSFFNRLSSACNFIRSTKERKLSLYCHMMYGLLEKRKENILTLSDAIIAAKYNDSYVLPNEREEVLDVLHSLNSTGLIKVLKSEDKVWVIVNKEILLSELNGILFAPETFKEHVNIASNTGIVRVSGLTRLFPDYDPDMLICFLKNMELCQEMSSLRMTNLIPLKSVEEEQDTEKGGERLLFFPCLMYSNRPDEMTSQVYQFGWCLQCTGEHHFFSPRYFHILSLHLAYKLALPHEDDKLNRYCKFWKNGLHWFNGHGIGVLVEIVDNSQCVLVLMSCKEGYNMVKLRREVIRKVMSVYKDSCPSLEVKELVIDPEELDYPVNTPKERTVYSVKAILVAIDEGRPFVVTDKGEKEVKSILPDESLLDVNKLSLLGGRDIKV